MALSSGSPPLAVSEQPALWSPDFPPAASAEADVASDRLGRSDGASLRAADAAASFDFAQLRPTPSAAVRLESVMRSFRIEHHGSAHYALARGDEALELLSGPPWAGGQPTGERVSLRDVRLLAPVTPTKIVCVGRNYAAHARELGNTVPSEPLLFLKPPSSLIGPEGAIVLPPASQRVEHEAEIGVVIGQRLKDATAEQVAAAVFGVTCVNDVTARDLQRKEVQFTRAKGFDTFCPVGPWIATDLSLAELSVIGRVNGQVRQHAPATEMSFSILELLRFISTVMTLEPGDLIATGTPEGVGPLAPGDVVEVEVSGVGVLRNTVAGEGLGTTAGRSPS